MKTYHREVIGVATKIRFASDGFQTVIELGGKVIGTGIEKFDFHHEGGEHAKMSLDIDLQEFSFLPDGAFDEAVASIIGKE